MSLLNDILRDLSQQQKHYQTATNADAIEMAVRANPTTAEQQLFQYSSVGRKAPIVWLPSAVVFIFVLIALLVAKQYFFMTDKTQQDGSAAVLPVSIAVAATENSGQPEPAPLPNFVAEELPPNGTTAGLVAQQPVGSESLTDEALPVISEPQSIIGEPQQVIDEHLQVSSGSQGVISESKKPISDAQQLKIYDLLQEASRAFTMERLTTPAHDNAYLYYQEILVIDAENPAAAQGLIKIAERYMAMADAKIQESDIVSAERLIDRAQSVMQDQSLFDSYREKIAQLRVGVQSVVTTENTHIISRNEGAVVMSEKPVEETSNNLSVRIQEPFVTNNEPQHLSISPNAGWQDKKSVQDAQLLIEKNNLSGAIQVLKGAIASADTPSASTKMLLDIYSQQQRLHELEALLTSATYLSAVEQAYYRAKLAMLNDQPDTAIGLLEAQHVNAENYEQYRALLASLYHSTARYREAASHYRRLLSSFGDKPAYWLGFALALDALEQNQSALQAYKRLTEFHDLQHEVRTYIEQRILELTPRLNQY